MKELKDYLHLYLGCEMQGRHGLIVPLNIVLLNTLLNNKYEMAEWKPILRPLSDITEEEKEQIGFKAFEILRRDEFPKTRLTAHNLGCVWAAKQTVFLLSKHFDLFGLIESGLAIDATLISTTIK